MVDPLNADLATARQVRGHAEAQAHAGEITHPADQHHSQRSTFATDRDAMGAQEPEGLANRAPEHRRDLPRRHAIRGHAPQIGQVAWRDVMCSVMILPRHTVVAAAASYGRPWVGRRAPIAC